jgi:aspartate/methionine/tyrosine aminotransferase
MSDFQPFVMERMMSKFEKSVEYNLSESGVHPLRFEELTAYDPQMMEDLLKTELDYAHANGIPELRRHIAGLYDGASPSDVLVTVGAIEANNISIRTLLSPGDEIVVMLPNYMQIWGLSINEKYRLKTFNLREDLDWAPDFEELESALTPETGLIAICNPSNPTGRILTEDEMERIIRLAERSGAWILADEVYRGADRFGEEENPSFYGRYDRVLAVGSMSKAYGLPGLRIGWVVAPEKVVDDIWARHEYTTLSAAMLSNKLAALALSPAVRPKLLARTREYIRRGYPVLQEWLDDQTGVFTVRPPDAAAIAFVRYNLDINSTALSERLREEKSVLIVPGDHFGLDRFVRISFGLPHDYLRSALQRIRELIEELAAAG